MIYILLSITCNIFVAILLKQAKRYEIDIKQAIVWNYAIAALLTLVLYSPQIPVLSNNDVPWETYLALGLMLPSLFVIIGIAIRTTGIVRTDVAQRLSLLLPIFSAFLLFKEDTSFIKLLGITMGIVAVVFSLPWTAGSGPKGDKKSWIYLLTVFFGMGIIDILFKQIAVTTSVPFTSSLLIVYCLAFSISIIALLLLFLTKRAVFSIKHLLAGCILGVANFGNILFYLKAHQVEADRPSLVFASMNIGVIVAGSLVGIWLFDEKLSRLNKFGIVLAVVAILIIFNS